MRICIDALEVFSSRSVTGGVWFEVGGRSFPEVGWNDFPVVLVGWWIAEFLKIGAGGGCRLCFMDGPFMVEVLAGAGDEVRATFLANDEFEFASEVSRSALAAELKAAAEVVLVFCRLHGFVGRDVEVLRRGRSQLERA